MAFGGYYEKQAKLGPIVGIAIVNVLYGYVQSHCVWHDDVVQGPAFPCCMDQRKRI